MESFDQFIDSLFTVERWPFWSAVLIFTIVGQFSAQNLFTRDRAYWRWPQAWQRFFWWWGRETLMLHPIVAGLVLGYFWVDPEDAGWGRTPSQMYFAAAGATSLFLWSAIKGLAKKRGVRLTLPGSSSSPPPSEP